MKTSIAIIADIHGNLPAFNAIIDDLKNYQIDNIIIPGDLITDCPDSNEVLNVIRKMSCTVIKGNREQYYIDHNAGLKDFWTDSKQMSSLIWSFNELSDENKEYIGQLNEQADLEIQGKTMKIVHGSPDSISELIYPVNKQERFREILSGLDEDIIICGHCHAQWDFQYENKVAINPGSAGVHFNEKNGAEYSIIHFIDGQISIEHKQIPYDLMELKNRFISSGLYHASPMWSESIIQSISKGENVSLQLIAYALDLMEQQGIKKEKTIPDNIWVQAGEEYLMKR